VSNLIPPDQSPTPNKPTKPNKPRLLTQQTLPLSQLRRKSTWNVAKKIITNLFATGLFVYGGYLVYNDKPEPGMAAIGTAVAIATSKQEDEDKQNSLLEEVQIKEELIEYYEKLNDFLQEQEKQSEEDKNNLKIEITRLKIELESQKRVAKLEIENGILITENKYIKNLQNQYQLPESKNQEFKPQQNTNKEQIEANDSESQS
jgi:ABC-type bacteriocin/lantibiotic exporter with double-glycine peptidase domain